MPSENDFVGLVGDIGGTNARFALARFNDGNVVLDQVKNLPVHDYPTLEAAVRSYLGAAGGPLVRAAAAACAGPVVDGAVAFTNIAWATNEASFAAAAGIERAFLLNDLAAVAWAAPALNPGRLRSIAHQGLAAVSVPAGSAGTRAILNAGTGSNASAFVQNSSGTAVVVGEYGHTSFAPSDELEVEIWRRLHARFGRVSVERVLCGPGLLNLYDALCAIDGVAASCATPAEVTAAMLAGETIAHRAVERFCALMGAVAGDVALAYGAQAGIYLCGGVAVQLLRPAFDDIFRQRFENKGRFRPYLAEIPTLVIEDSQVALIGAARAMVSMTTLSGAA